MLGRRRGDVNGFFRERFPLGQKPIGLDRTLPWRRAYASGLDTGGPLGRSYR
jgi:hypothetical protein